MVTRIAWTFRITVLLMAGAHAAIAQQPPKWTDAFKEVGIPSSVDGVLQKAYFHSARGADPRPLLISLHTWSGDYKQGDPLAVKAAEGNWNYIHPDFRGPNWTPDACMSPKALADIDDAIQYAIENGRVDENNLFVVGLSGGGYATFGVYLKTRHPVKAFLAWAGISDLTAWYWQSRNLGNEYADHILLSTQSEETLDPDAADKRSPLKWSIETLPNGRLEIYEGIDDGYTGSVPISHSLLFYNKVAMHAGKTDSLVTPEEMVTLITRAVDRNAGETHIGDRNVIFARDAGPVSIAIFDGGHEMVVDYCFQRLLELAAAPAANHVSR